MSDTPLFPHLEIVKSPRLAWMERYGLATWSYVLDGEELWACGPEAQFVQTVPQRETVFNCESEMDATIEWAALHKINHWTLE